MTTAVAVPNGMAIIEDVITKGDLSKLTAEQRVTYYRATCESLGLNPLVKPFEYLVLRKDGPMVLYATKTATDQLRKVHGVTIAELTERTAGDVYIVTAKARDKEGREDISTGAVNIKGLYGDGLANAYMKAETKAKRRVTLSICGLGWLDESEIETIPTAARVAVDTETGEILDAEPAGSSRVRHPQLQAAEIAAELGAITETRMRELHAIGKERGLTHDELHALVVAKGVGSMSDLTEQQGQVLARWLRTTTPDKLRAALDKAGVPVEPPADAEQQGRLSDEEIAAMATAAEQPGNDKHTR